MVEPYLEQQNRNPITWAIHQLDETKYVGQEGMIILADYLKVRSLLVQYLAKTVRIITGAHRTTNALR